MKKIISRRPEAGSRRRRFREPDSLLSGSEEDGRLRFSDPE